MRTLLIDFLALNGRLSLITNAWKRVHRSLVLLRSEQARCPVSAVGDGQLIVHHEGQPWVDALSASASLVSTYFPFLICVHNISSVCCTQCAFHNECLSLAFL